MPPLVLKGEGSSTTRNGESWERSRWGGGPPDQSCDLCPGMQPAHAALQRGSLDLTLLHPVSPHALHGLNPKGSQRAREWIGGLRVSFLGKRVGRSRVGSGGGGARGRGGALPAWVSRRCVTAAPGLSGLNTAVRLQL